MSNSAFRIPHSEFAPRTVHGFTLIEVLIASTILALATGAVLSLGRTAIRSYDISFARSQAYLYVQEGLEIVRSIRDTSAVDQRLNDWLAVFPASLTSYQGRWDAILGRWQFAVGDEELSPAFQPELYYRRTIRFSLPPTLPPLMTENGISLPTGISDNVRAVTVEVSWEENGQTQRVTGSTLLTNWQPEE